MKICPFCAEEIQDAAIVCKHCRSDLRKPVAPPVVPTEVPQPEQAAPLSLFIPRVPVFVMILFHLLTLGFYGPVWFLRRRRGFTHLGSPRTLDTWPFVVTICLIAVHWLFMIAAGGRPGIVDDLVGVVIAVLMVIQAFKAKDIIEDHLTEPEGPSVGILSEGARLSGLMTFFLGILYLQHALNTRVLSCDVAPAESTVGLGLG